MPGQGQAPRAQRSRRRDTEARAAEMTTLRPTGRLRGPTLPKASEALGEGQEWHPQTVKLWDALRRDPIMAAETPVGWQFLLDTALMHHTMWSKGRWEFAGEVRLRLAKFGATPEDRMRLKVQVLRPERPSKTAKPEPAEETPAAARRRGLHIAG